MPKDYEDTLTMINLVLTIAFMVEMVFKVLGLGPKKYVQDNFNIFDALVVFMSIVELAMANSGSRRPPVVQDSSDFEVGAFVEEAAKLPLHHLPHPDQPRRTFLSSLS